MEKLDVDAIATEVASGNFSDKRLVTRLDSLVRSIASNPSASLPGALTSAELEGAYRFFSNVRVTPEAILAPHFQSTKQRAEAEQRVLVLHDQTWFSYRPDGKRRFGKGRAGPSSDGFAGFAGHFSLVVSADGSRKPLGLIGVETWERGESKQPEQAYWCSEVEATSQRLGLQSKPIHVADRGAEDYVLFHDLMAADHRFVLRVGNRYTESGPGGSHVRLRDVLSTIERVCEREAKINRRKHHSRKALRKIHPPREVRTVTLHIAATRVVLARPPGSSPDTKARLATLPKTIELNVVRVWEPNPPENTEPVEWFLFTNEPIDSESNACAVVDHYRARWTIEEYFKALKTGCAFEKRQLHDYESLVNALGVFAPIAYHVLLLRTQARDNPDAPASTVVSDDHIAVLRVLGRRKLPEQPTARDALLAVAALGGHIKYAPDPGWLTIARGFEKLEFLTQGWKAAKLHQASDQR